MTDTSTPTLPVQTVQTEVPINPDQPSSPNPITNAPPEKPAGDRAPSRREAIQAAFDRATRQQDGKEAKAAPKKAEPVKAAEAKAGHNKPPEETEKIDLKKRPGEQPRGDRGQFTRRDPELDHQGEIKRGRFDEQAAKGANGTEPEGSAPTLPENAPYREPPPRMAEHARREWAAAPESVRGEVHRMHQEYSTAYNQYRGAAEAFQPIARFHQMASEHGTTLERALTNYTSMEAKLRSDVVGGLDVIVNNLGLRSSDGQPIGLRDIAYHVLSQSPDQLKQIQMGNQQSAAGQQIGALHEKISTLENRLQQWQTAQQFTYTRSQVDQFADSHTRFDELGALIKQELELGFDLETAYRRAELLQPATHAAQTGTPAAQTRAPADRSISGSPGGVTGSNPAPRRSEKPVGRREAIANAIRRVNGG
jgi:hypothetical protein